MKNNTIYFNKLIILIILKILLFVALTILATLFIDYTVNNGSLKFANTLLNKTIVSVLCYYIIETIFTSLITVYPKKSVKKSLLVYLIIILIGTGLKMFICNFVISNYIYNILGSYDWVKENILKIIFLEFVLFIAITSKVLIKYTTIENLTDLFHSSEQ